MITDYTIDSDRESDLTAMAALLGATMWFDMWGRDERNKRMCYIKISEDRNTNWVQGTWDVHESRKDFYARVETCMLKYITTGEQR